MALVDNLLNIDRLNKAQVEDIIYLASSLKKDFPNSTKDSPLKGKNVIFLFLESSTRTKTSFNFACSILGANVIDISPKSSSMTKGETFENTIKTISSYPADALVLRSNENNDINIAKNILDFPVINAGSGTKSHPTQALTDLMTLIEKGFSIEKLKISIVGDIEHSRVARSLIELLNLFGSIINICSPKYFKPTDLRNISYFEDLHQALKNVDVLMTLRIQKERIEKSKINFNQYSDRYMITEKMLNEFNVSYLMHPGPVNEGIEIDRGLQDSSKSLILEQVKNGTWIRCAVLMNILLNGKL
ncbi:MAG: aspartate carbamoyltransferase [Chloroflexi bacterium]|nr:aspartate carbamoyltransferase [Chloroflexota bacterium]